ncbi:hypothetical protein [Azospirillum sp. TSO5]|uniref:hypothetical protein n=1 Tax=Azospirillum sp. TSO5 TaxID=716760 RepID=UPI000D64E6E4|nr:hypothetical protein [Azospirillum sp. TSO5]
MAEDTKRALAYAAAAVLCGLGAAMAMAAASLSADGILMWVAEASGFDIIARVWIAAHWAWAGIVKAASKLVGGADVAKAVALWLSYGVALGVGLWGYRRGYRLARAYIVIRAAD